MMTSLEDSFNRMARQEINRQKANAIRVVYRPTGPGVRELFEPGAHAI